MAGKKHISPKKHKSKKGTSISPKNVEEKEHDCSSEAAEQLLLMKNLETSEPLVRPNSMQSTEPPQSEPIQDTNNTVETKKRKSGGPRGICAMYKVLVKKARRKKIKVTYNERGIPDGPNRTKLQSYIGMLARTMVPIDKPSWPKVMSDLKNKIWDDVQETFKIKPESHDYVLKSAGVKWRQFKADLMRKHVMPFVGQSKKLLKPPDQYSFVGKRTWRRFVQQRTTENWQKLHDQQSEKAIKRKYPYRLSRKGYIGLKEDEIKKGRLKVGEEPDRAVLWKKARIGKGGAVDDDQAQMNEKIDNLLEKKFKGEFQPSGCCDVLTTALETPEHSGRVRAVGGFITPKSFFNLPRQSTVKITKSELLARDRQRSEEFDLLKSEMSQLKAWISAQPNLQSPKFDSEVTSDHPEKNGAPNKLTDLEPIAEEGSELVKEDDCVTIDPPAQPNGNKIMSSCEFSVDNINNKVAFGAVFPREDDLIELVHGQPLKSGFLRVSVDGCFKPDAMLPVPVRGDLELLTVYQAVGYHVAWPEDMIVYPTVTKKKEKGPSKVDDLYKMQNLFNNTQMSKNVPNCFKILYKTATTYMTASGASIQLPCDVDVFGYEKTIFILSDNLVALLEFEMIGASVISTYMMYLHTKIRDMPDLVETFMFCDPASTYHINADFERYVINRLKEGPEGSILFLPHNPNVHWILTIIWDGEIYVLNPLPQPTHFPALEKALISAVKTFYAQKGCNKTPKVKILSGSPKQPSGHECGYVILRYMKDIIEDVDVSFHTKWMNKSRKSYTIDQLDEVRMEVLTFIQDHM